MAVSRAHLALALMAMLAVADGLNLESLTKLKRYTTAMKRKAAGESRGRELLNCNDDSLTYTPPSQCTVLNDLFFTDDFFDDDLSDYDSNDEQIFQCSSLFTEQEIADIRATPAVKDAFCTCGGKTEDLLKGIFIQASCIFKAAAEIMGATETQVSATEKILDAAVKTIESCPYCDDLAKVCAPGGNSTVVTPVVPHCSGSSIENGSLLLTGILALSAALIGRAW